MGRNWDHAEGREPTAWPTWSPLVSLVIVAVTAALSLVLRRGMSAPSASALYIAVASLPFVLDAADIVAPVRLRLPLFLFPIPTLIGASLLVWHPPHNDFAPFFFVIVTSAVASRADENFSFAVGVGIVSALLMAGAEVFGPYRVAIPWVVGICFGWFGGFSVGKLIRTLHDLRRAQADLADRAAADERRRIAREVHDVIAHSLSVTILHVSGARMGLERIADDQPSEQLTDAIEALREAEGQGRSSLGDIKRTVGLLGPKNGSSPSPRDINDLPRLINEFSSAGVNVTLAVDGPIAELAPTAALNLYRIVQESLTNVVKHAPGADASVEVVVDSKSVRLVVRNGSSSNGAHHFGAPTSGLGLPGMTERAGVMGGTLSAGPDGEGWRVELTAPRHESQ